MNNLVIQTIREGIQRGWCMSLDCTACGALDYREKLQELAGPLGGPLADALSNLDIGELTALSEWQDAVLTAITELPFSAQRDGVLKAWLPKIHQYIRFADHVLFRLVRYLPSNDSMRKQWIDECVTMAIQSKDSSLVESLLLVLHQGAKAYPELVALATEQARTSTLIRKVLQNKCNVKADTA